MSNYGYQILDHLGNVMSGTQSAIHYLGTINVSAYSGAGSQVIAGAKYAIATPARNDALAPRVDVNPDTGLVSWPSSAVGTDIADWFNGGTPDADVAMAITVIGTGRASYGLQVTTETGNQILDTSAQAIALVASATGVVGTVRSDGTRRIDITTSHATSDRLLVFVRSSGYVGLSALGVNSAQLMCCTSAPVDYKIFAVVDSFAGAAYRAGKYGLLTFTAAGKVSFSGQEKYLSIAGQVQKPAAWPMHIYPGADPYPAGDAVSAVAPVANPYVCINSLRGPTTSIFPPLFAAGARTAYTTAACRVGGSGVYWMIDSVYVQPGTASMNLTINLPALNQRFLLCL